MTGSGDNGKIKNAGDGGYIKKIKIGDKEIAVKNSCTVIEIVAHQLENGQEVQQVIAQGFMMTDHKVYMVKALTDAINTVTRAEKNKPKIIPATMNVLNRIKNRANNGGFGKGN